MSEIADFGAVVLIIAAGFALGLLSTRVTDHVPVKTVVRIAVVALIVILFTGGMDIGWRRFRSAAGPILLLGIAGTFVTAAVVARVAHYALGFGWRLAGLVSAAVGPTDP